MRRQLALFVSILLMLSLVAPIAAPAGAQDGGTPVVTSAESADPPPADMDPAATEPPAVTEPPAEDAAPQEPDPASEPPPEAVQEQPNAPPAEEPASEPAAATEESHSPAETVEEPPVESSLTVTVLDNAGGMPIAGASVSVRDISGTEVGFGLTDASGGFTATGLTGGDYWVDVSAAGYLPGYGYSWVDGAVAITVYLDIAPLPGSLALVVTDDSNGAAIEGASVIVYDGYWNVVASGATDATGTFATGELSGGQYSVEITHPSFYSSSSYFTVNGSVEHSVILQPLPEAGTLTILVVDSGTQAPIGGASVTVYDASWTIVASGATDETGTFATGEISGGEHHTEISADTYYPWNGYLPVSGPSEHTVSLQRAPNPGTLTITVIDALTDAPITGANVQVWANGYITGATDENGVFTTPELPAGTYYPEASAEGYLTGYGAATVDGPVETTIALEPILPGVLTVHAVNQETGAPIAGASVLVRDYWTGEELASGPTGDDGTFATSDLPGGEYTVEVSAQHHVTGYANSFVNGPTDVTVGLEAIFPGAVTVTVLDRSTGAPIAGAAMLATDGSGAELASGTTDAAGVWVTPELPGGNVNIGASAQGYAWTPPYYLRLNGSTAITIELTPLAAGDLTVTVTEQWTWTPIAGVSVTVRDAVSGAEVASGTTGASGVYVASGLPGGSYAVDVTADGYFPASGEASVDGSGSVAIQMRPQVAGTLTVTVRDGWFGDPVPGASVVVTDPATGIDVAAGDTDESGAFTSDTLAGGPYDVAVTAPGYASGAAQAYVSGDSSVSIWLQPVAGTLTVTVVDAVSGDPVAGATVTVKDSWSVVASGTTDASGAFVTDELASGDYFVEVSADEYFWYSDWARVRGDTVFTVPLEPRVAGALTVRVTDADTGEPIHKASVVVNGGLLPEPVIGATDSKGVFISDTLPGDWYLVEVSAEGYTEEVQYTLVSGPTDAAFALYPRTPGTVTVTVVDQVTGDPIGDAQIEVRDDATGSVVASGKTKKSGEFITKELPGGSYSIRAEAEGYFVGWNSAWVSGDSAVTVWMSPRLPGTLTVMALDQVTGAPIVGAGVVVTRMSDGAEAAAGTTDASGVFVSGELEAGAYSVDVTAAGYFPWRNAAADIYGDTELTLSLQPAAAGTITVRVVGQSTWQPIAGATVTVRDSRTNEEIVAGTSDGLGYFVTPELPGGDYMVRATADGYFMIGGAYVRVDGATQTWLEMAPGEPGALTVSVVDYTGIPVGSASVVVSDANGTVTTGITDDGGVFVTDELPPGGYSVEASATGYVGGWDFTLVNGPTEVTAYLYVGDDAKLALSETDVVAGMKVTITGSGFQPGERVVITWRTPDGMALATPKAKSDGTISDRIVVPDVPDGRYYIVAMGVDSGITGAVLITVGNPGGP